MDIIENKLENAGYNFLGGQNIYQLISEIFKTKNVRYLKAIPFLIYKYRLDIEELNKLNSNSLFRDVISITKKLFEKYDIKINIPLSFTESLNQLNFEEFEQEFELQIKSNKSLIDKQKIYAIRELEMSLSKIFTKKERQIIKRLLDNKPISKTDYEYYSRQTKKKLKSIINLEEFAKSIFDKNPKLDEDLFLLKKSLEEFIEKTSKDENVYLIEFFLWDEDKLALTYTKKDSRYSKNQFFNTQVKITKIHDKNILQALKKYKKHKFV